MATADENRKLIGSILKLAEAPEARSQGMKTTNVPGFPLYLCWARWGGSELNASGNNKAFLFLPYLQSGQMPLQKFDDTSSIESPLSMVASGVPNPYNCKLSVTPSLNISHLVEGEFYWFVVSLKPAAVTGGGNSTPYWDGHVKAFGSNINEVFKDYVALFSSTKAHWQKMRKSLPTYEEEGENTSNSSE